MPLAARSEQRSCAARASAQDAERSLGVARAELAEVRARALGEDASHAALASWWIRAPRSMTRSTRCPRSLAL